MPVYEYKSSREDAACDYCRRGFTIEQRITEPRLPACPQCGAPVDRLLFPPSVSSPAGNAHLKNLGFTKLVKRDQGVYENVTATSKESRYMVSGQQGTLPDLKSKISD